MAVSCCWSSSPSLFVGEVECGKSVIKLSFEAELPFCSRSIYICNSCKNRAVLKRLFEHPGWQTVSRKRFLFVKLPWCACLLERIPIGGCGCVTMRISFFVSLFQMKCMLLFTKLLSSYGFGTLADKEQFGLRARLCSIVQIHQRRLCLGIAMLKSRFELTVFRDSCIDLTNVALL